jgi:ADP-ribosylglycohydrolase
MKSKQVHAAFIGLVVGDALGVPVEFQSREYLRLNPISEMMGFGTHNQPEGTWSDDSSLAFCLADSLCTSYNLEDIATKFLEWYNTEIWTPHGYVFDIGIATSQAVYRVAKGVPPTLCGGFEEKDNGNGSLMRILPLAFYLKNEENIDVIFEKVKEVSSITHAHFRSFFACFIYIIYTLELINEQKKDIAYTKMQIRVNNFIAKNDFNKNEIQLFSRILEKDVSELEENVIQSSGYVLHTLEASLWSLLTTNSYQEAVLKAVNLGEDTDTTACVTGGLAGLYYGLEAIPEKWINVLARKDDIIDLCDRFELKFLI